MAENAMKDVCSLTNPPHRHQGADQLRCTGQAYEGE